MREREFKPIICQHCQGEFVPTSSTQKYHPGECSRKEKYARRRERYQTAPEFRGRLQRHNRISGKRAHIELGTEKLTALLSSTTRLVNLYSSGPLELFPSEEGELMVLGEELFFRNDGVFTPLQPREAVIKFSYKKIKEAIGRVVFPELRSPNSRRI